MSLEKEVQLISAAIDKAFKSGVYGVSESSQILPALGALQAAHYSDKLKKQSESTPMEIVEEDKGQEPVKE